MTELKERFEREVAFFSLVPDAWERTMRRVERRRRVRRVGIAVFALVIATIGIVGAVSTFSVRRSHPIGRVVPTTLVPTGPTPTGAGPVRREIVGAAWGYGSMWLLSCDDCTDATVTSGRAHGTLLRIDPNHQLVTARIPVRDPYAMAVGAGGVWVTNFAAGSVQRIDPSRGEVVATIPLALPFEVAPGDRAFLAEGVAIGEGAVWVGTARSAIAKIDPGTNRVLAVIKVRNYVLGALAVGEGSAWVTAGLDGLVRIDAQTNAIVASVPPARRGTSRLDYESIVINGGWVFAAGGWVNGSGVGVGASGLARIDPGTDTVSEAIELVGPASNPGVQIAAAGKRLVTMGGGYFGEILVPSLTQVPSFQGLPSGPNATVVAVGAVWVIGTDGSVQRYGL